MKWDNTSVWVGLDGREVRVATTLKGLCDDLGLAYRAVRYRRGQVKEIGEDWFPVSGSRWIIREVELLKVSGRGGKRTSGRKVVLDE